MKTPAVGWMEWRAKEEEVAARLWLGREGGREGGPGRTEIHHPGPYVYTTSQHNSLNKTISTISSRD